MKKEYVPVFLRRALPVLIDEKGKMVDFATSFEGSFSPKYMINLNFAYN